ncbi:MAG: hypothetical protein IKM06_05505 [Clostridia bacterium]|nr:hypothetical protein [Clostridia bacterium]
MEAENIKVDFNKTIGTIKPMHAVGQPPFVGMNFKYIDYLTEANIPYSRLHDVGGPYGRGVFVDIPNLFRCFDADENDPASYDFAFTDELLKNLIDRGVEPFFRLGVTIENYRKIKAYNIDPPKDNEKWARICEHVIRHYTEGWADGFNFNITYWEIWNEPDNYESPEENQMWSGTPLQFYELYGVAAKHLKKCFPHLKIGGYGSCGFYSLTAAKNQFGNSSSRLDYFITFFEGFLDYIKEHKCPMDFFSWHSYAGIEDNLVWAKYARRMLDEAGYTKCEHILNEWNASPDLKGTLRHAALTTGMMLALQNTTLDMAMFYDARMGMGTYAGMFNCMTYKPLPAYYGFKAFGEMYTRKEQAFVSLLPEKVYACAARGNDGVLVIANTNEKPVKVSLEILGLNDLAECSIITESGFSEFSFNNVLPENSVLMFKYK